MNQQATIQAAVPVQIPQDDYYENYTVCLTFFCASHESVATLRKYFERVIEMEDAGKEYSGELTRIHIGSPVSIVSPELKTHKNAVVLTGKTAKPIQSSDLELITDNIEAIVPDIEATVCDVELHAQWSTKSGWLERV